MKIIKILFFIIFVGKIYSQEIIQMEKINNVNHIPCKVNGIPMKLIFDTGASNVSISITEAKFLIKQGLIAREDLLGNVKYQMADGGIVQGEKFIIRSIEIGNKKITNIEATIMHNQDAPLLLGQSAINKLGKYSINENKLILEEVDNSKNKTILIDDLQGYSYLKFNSSLKDINYLNFQEESDQISLYQLTTFEENINSFAKVYFDLAFLGFDKNKDQLKLISFAKKYVVEQGKGNQVQYIDDMKIIVRTFAGILGSPQVIYDEKTKALKNYWHGKDKSLDVKLDLIDVGTSEIGMPILTWNLKIIFMSN